MRLIFNSINRLTVLNNKRCLYGVENASKCNNKLQSVVI